MNNELKRFIKYSNYGYYIPFENIRKIPKPLIDKMYTYLDLLNFEALYKNLIKDKEIYLNNESPTFRDNYYKYIRKQKINNLLNE